MTTERSTPPAAAWPGCLAGAGASSTTVGKQRAAAESWLLSPCRRHAGGRSWHCLVHGQPARGAGAAAVRILPVRGPVQPTDVVLESIAQSPVGNQHEQRLAVGAAKHAGKAR